jgi:hypothetical protein
MSPTFLETSTSKQQHELELKVCFVNKPAFCSSAVHSKQGRQISGSTTLLRALVTLLTAATT